MELVFQDTARRMPKPWSRSLFFLKEKDGGQGLARTIAHVEARIEGRTPDRLEERRDLQTAIATIRLRGETPLTVLRKWGDENFADSRHVLAEAVVKLDPTFYLGKEEDEFPLDGNRVKFLRHLQSILGEANRFVKGKTARAQSL